MLYAHYLYTTLIRHQTDTSLASVIGYAVLSVYGYPS